MSQAQNGDAVKVHYVGTLTDGTLFDSSQGREPLEFVLGTGKVIPGFENALVGMSVGESKTVTIPADAAYGQRHEHMIREVPRVSIPDDIQLSEGMVLHAQGPEGQTLSFTVASFDDEMVKIDGNNPLAGKDLTFALELVAIG